MTLPHVATQREVVRALERAGFTVRRQTGSHVVMSDGRHSTSVPRGTCKDLHRKTLAQILR